MNPHPRIRKTVKWGGAVVTVLLVVVWVGSGLGFAQYTDSHGRVIGVGAGRLLLTDPIPPPASPVPPFKSMILLGTRIEPSKPQPGWRVIKIESWHVAWPIYWTNNASGRSLALPLWMLIVPSFLPFLFALRLEASARRRARLNLCPKCQYDRTGLAQGAVCPECGKLPG